MLLPLYYENASSRKLWDHNLFAVVVFWELPQCFAKPHWDSWLAPGNSWLDRSRFKTVIWYKSLIVLLAAIDMISRDI